jgi:hypothetical protein
MVKRFLCVLGLCVVAAAPAPAWGGDGHRFILDRAIAQLPPELRPFFEKHRAFLLEHASDPDLWAGVGFAEEETRHFIDLDAYGAYPFATLPRELGQAIRQVGPETVTRRGTLPWRTDEISGRLLRAFSGSRGPNLDDVRYLSMVLAHYVADAYVPFHAVTDYDGQLTGQTGIHSRFESELFRRYSSSLSITPGVVRDVPSVRDLMFDALVVSFDRASAVLAADREAAAGRDAYDDAYFKMLFEKTRPVLERRVGDAITAVASALTSLWQQAGKPALPLEQPPRRARPIVRK